MPKLSDNVYVWLKWIALIALPVIATFLSVVLSALKVDSDTVKTVTTIITATGALIGGLIGVSTKQYKKEHDIIVQDKTEENGETK